LSQPLREIEEELGIPANKVSSDFQIVYYDIGSVVNDIPRMNLFFIASVPRELLKQTEHVAKLSWFNEGEFLKLNLNPSYNKTKLTDIIF
jgi:8-oxo-dGTP pyrophosphatase MutT (NUDIX family)